MSIQLHNRIKTLEQELIEVKARLELLEEAPDFTGAASLSGLTGSPNELVVVTKRGPGRPKKVADGH